jgi:hypothetical protein
MGFKSVMKSIGHGFKVAFGVAEKIQDIPAVQIAESVFIPAKVVALITAAFHSVAGAEVVTETAVANPNLSGAQKMAVAMAAFEAAYQDYSKAAGIPGEPASAQAILQAVYDILNQIPAGKILPAPPAS